jgi:hypothetical protein
VLATILLSADCHSTVMVITETRCKSKENLTVSQSLQELIKKYHAFYEVLPYCAVVEEHHGSPKATRRVIQAGFDVDVHGLSNKAEVELPPPEEYAFGYAELKKMADTVSHQTSECSIEVIPFPSSVVSEARENFRSEAVIRIRISHNRGLEPAGLAEQHALEEVEKQLQGLGMRHR